MNCVLDFNVPMWFCVLTSKNVGLSISLCHLRIPWVDPLPIGKKLDSSPVICLLSHTITPFDKQRRVLLDFTTQQVMLIQVHTRLVITVPPPPARSTLSSEILLFLSCFSLLLFFSLLCSFFLGHCALVLIRNCSSLYATTQKSSKSQIIQLRSLE